MGYENAVQAFPDLNSPSNLGHVSPKAGRSIQFQTTRNS
jgi:hypothetical protein